MASKESQLKEDRSVKMFTARIMRTVRSVITHLEIAINAKMGGSITIKNALKVAMSCKISFTMLKHNRISVMIIMISQFRFKLKNYKRHLISCELQSF